MCRRWRTVNDAHIAQPQNGTMNLQDEMEVDPMGAPPRCLRRQLLRLDTKHASDLCYARSVPGRKRLRSPRPLSKHAKAHVCMKKL